jgi:hypothetical protein
MAMLWAWLATCDDLSKFAEWPLVPVHGGLLRALQPCAVSPVVLDVGWSENMCAVLHTLGCRRLDTKCLAGPTGGPMLRNLQIIPLNSRPLLIHKQLY